MNAKSMVSVGHRFKASRAAVFASLAAIAGVVVVRVIFAVGTPAAFEAEVGGLGGGATNVADINASGGHAVKFGSGGTGGLPAGVTLKAIDGGPNYFGDHGFTYAHNAGWDNPSFFAIGLWMPRMLAQTDASRWIDLNLNTDFNPIGGSDISLLRTNGLFAEGFGDATGQQNETVGLFTADEAGTFADGVSTPIGTTANSAQDGRFWWINNTWNFIAYGGLQGTPTPGDSATVLDYLVTTPNGTKRHVDIQSIDEYWFAGAKSFSALLYQGGTTYNLGRDMTIDEAARGSHYGDMIDRLRAYQIDHYPAPIASFVEDGGPYNENTSASSYIFPPELNAAVWSSIIHGARQIVYFNHSFAGPALSQDNLDTPYYQTVQPGQTISIYNQTKATDALVKQMAPVINSPTALGYVTVSPAPATFSGVDTMAKYSGGKFTIFANTRESTSKTNLAATFTIKNTGASFVTVVNENRTIPITNGGTTFTDTFATGSTVHIYQVN